MRLVYQLTLIYIVISLVVLGVGAILTYNIMKSEIQREEQRFLKERLNSYVEFIERRGLRRTYQRNKSLIIPLGENAIETGIVFSDTLVQHAVLNRMELHNKLDVVKEVKGKFYKFTIYDLIVEEDDIYDGVVSAMTKISIILTLVLIVLSFIASKILLKPFHTILDVIKSIDLQESREYVFPKSRTSEIKRLAHFLSEMTSKAQQDYKSLKEFNENASHEMQTPLAIAGAQLELLLQGEGLTDEQMTQVAETQKSLKRLSNLGTSLALLNKIDNKEFSEVKPVAIHSLLISIIQSFEPLIKMRGISLTTDLATTEISANESLMEILISNILKNAIAHNKTEGGEIAIVLKDKKLTVSNTGAEPKLPIVQYFERFKKGGNSKSLGLGLSIVRKICLSFGYTVSYRFEADWHIIDVKFIS